MSAKLKNFREKIFNEYYFIIKWIAALLSNIK